MPTCQQEYLLTCKFLNISFTEFFQKVCNAKLLKVTPRTEEESQATLATPRVFSNVSLTSYSQRPTADSRRT